MSWRERNGTVVQILWICALTWLCRIGLVTADTRQSGVVHASDEDVSRRSVFTTLEEVSSSKQGGVTSRSLLQDRGGSSAEDVECTLNRTQISNLRDATSSTWLIDDDVLESIGNDLQTIVNCTQEGDIILFGVSDVIRPPRRINIPRNLTLSTNTSQTDLIDGVFPETTTKTVFGCRRNQGIFLISSEEVLLANLAFEGCSLKSKRDPKIVEGCSLNLGRRSAIVEVKEGASNETRGAIKLHHVSFTDSELNGAPAIFAGTTTGSSVEIIDAAFVNNTCSGICFAHLSAKNHLDNISIHSIRGIQSSGPKHIALHLPSGSSSTVIDLRADDNEVSVLEVMQDGSLELIKSRFSNNVGRSTLLLRGAGTVNVADCVFSTNSATTENGGAIFAESTKNIRLSGCELASNSAKNGGAIYAQKSGVNITGGQFTNNSAIQNGGAAFFDQSEGQFLDCILVNNSASDGGGIVAKKSELSLSLLRFIGNNAKGGDGGGIRCERESSLTINKTFFATNNAKYRGGSIYLTDSEMKATLTVFYKDTCGKNGAGIALNDNSSGIVSQSDFLDEEADYGAAVSVRDSTLNMEKSRMQHCIARKHGGAIRVHRGLKLSLVNCNFSRNQAQTGGAVFCSDTEEVSIRDCDLRKNTADGPGGAIALQDASSLEMSNTRISENEAFRGAAIALRRDSRATINGSQFEGNRVEHGPGGAIFVEKSTLAVGTSVFETNSARRGGAIELHKQSNATVTGSHFERDKSSSVGGSIGASSDSTLELFDTSITGSWAQSKGGGIHVDGAIMIATNLSIINCSVSKRGGALHVGKSSTAFCVSCTFHGNKASESGGAVSVIARSPIESFQRALQLIKCDIRNNSAKFGGALFVRSEKKSEEDCDLIRAKCIFVSLVGTQLADNTAKAGGAIFVSSRGMIRFNCSIPSGKHPVKFHDESEFRSLSVLTSKDDVCRDWTNNNASEYGPVVATDASLVKWKVDSVQPKGPTYNEENQRSGKPLKVIELEVRDAFDQGPVRGRRLKPVKAEMSSPNGFFAGTVSRVLFDGRGNFSGIAYFVKPKRYLVVISFNNSALPNFTINVNITDCSLGEKLSDDMISCERCSEKEYRLDLSDDKCHECPENGDCSLLNAVLPVAGYWIRTACSLKIRECLVKSACMFKDRKDKMKNETKNMQSCDFNGTENQTAIDFAAAQCNEGHRGLLCGSCEQNYSLTQSFECRKCSSPYVNRVVLAVAVVVVLALASFPIKSSLPSHSAPASASELSSISIVSEDNHSAAIRVQMAERTDGLPVPSEIVIPAQSSPVEEQNTLRKAEMMKTKMVEIFKIGVNFLQGLSVAISISVNWTSGVKQLFSSAGIVANVMSDTAAFSARCAIGPKKAVSLRPVIGSLINLFIPVIAMAFYAAFWTIAKCRYKRSRGWFVKRVLLSVVAVSYLTYTSITRTAVNLLNCVSVYDSLEHGSEDKNRYWALDTDRMCDRWPHRLLAVAVGWPIILLFSIGLPATVAYLLIKRRSNETSSVLLADSALFLYRAYKDESVFWESVIMLRKALLVTIVVFSYVLGGNLQGILSVFVLLIALYAHCSSCPFIAEFNVLNTYEGLSLFVSTCTFASGLLFNDNRTSDWMRMAISILLILSVGGLFLFFVCKFLHAGAEYSRIMLEAEGFEDVRELGMFCSLKRFLVFRLTELRSQFKDYTTQLSLATNKDASVSGNSETV